MPKAKMTLSMRFKNETKTCYRFECGDTFSTLTSLYLKKAEVDGAGIDPKKGITVMVEEGNHND